LDPEDETDADVTWEDQCKINTFSRLNYRFQNKSRSFKEKKLEKESIEDLIAELELMDEDESLPYKMGDSFFLLPYNEAQELLEIERNQVNEEVAQLEAEIFKLTTHMEELKKDLYKKFGKAINLET
ncbi:hypothetical protein PORY_002196, partial [Pneumocystis oryctolagi]